METETGWQIETDLTLHRLDVNPDAAHFSAADGGATEREYLDLLSALVHIFRPTHLFETGTWTGHGAEALIRAAGPGALIGTINDSALPEATTARLNDAARETRNRLSFLQANTDDLMHNRLDITWHDFTEGKATFAFLDTSISIRSQEFEYISNPENSVLDFSRPLCVCVHDMSRYRHPYNHETNSLARTLQHIDAVRRERGWQSVRFSQSRGLLVLAKYPTSAGIDGECIIPAELISDEDTRDSLEAGDPYLITEYYPLLADLVRAKQPRAILEIGVRYGYSLAVMLDAAPTIEEAYAVDASVLPPGRQSGGGSAQAYAAAQRNLRTLWRQGRWQQLIALSFYDMDTQTHTWLPVPDSQIDFAYIDGDGSPEGCLHDLDLALTCMADGGLIVGDDCDYCGLRPHMEGWAQAHGFTHSYVPDSSGRGRIVITVSKS